MKRRRIDQVADALLAYQTGERDDDGQPSDRARIGALWHAEQGLILRDLLHVMAAYAARR